MKRLVTATMALMLCGGALAAPKPCEELKQEIEVKIQAARVNRYTLEIVPAGRARDLGFERPAEWQRDGFRLNEGREAVHAYVTALIERGTVQDRASMVQALTEAGLGVTRQGKDYLTVQDAESGDRLRLKVMPLPSAGVMFAAPFAPTTPWSRSAPPSSESR